MKLVYYTKTSGCPDQMVSKREARGLMENHGLNADEGFKKMASFESPIIRLSDTVELWAEEA